MLKNHFHSKLEIIANQIDIYADIKNQSEILTFRDSKFIKGFTSNPTLIRKGGATNYLEFVQHAIKAIGDSTISIEVIADDFDEMYRQALLLNQISERIYVKIPIYNSRHKTSVPIIKKLILEGIPLNVTAIMTLEQLNNLFEVVGPSSDLILSIFAGRIADTGVDPIPFIKYSVELFQNHPTVRTLWASPREVFNIQQAIDCGCHIITAVPEILSKLDLIGKDLDKYSLETVQMFHNDAKESKYVL
jgi:transaldolase